MRTRTLLVVLVVLAASLALRPVRRAVGERVAIVGLRLAGSATPRMSRAAKRRHRRELRKVAVSMRREHEHPAQPI